MISNIDINDWICVGQPEKLYNLKRNSVFSFVDNPADAYFFNKVDGAYSLCHTLDGTIFHPSAWSDVFAWVKK